jgi:hypothetical protein
MRVPGVIPVIPGCGKDCWPQPGVGVQWSATGHEAKRVGDRASLDVSRAPSSRGLTWEGTVPREKIALNFGRVCTLGRKCSRTGRARALRPRSRPRPAPPRPSGPAPASAPPLRPSHFGSSGAEFGATSGRCHPRSGRAPHAFSAPKERGCPAHYRQPLRDAALHVHGHPALGRGGQGARGAQQEGE